MGVRKHYTCTVAGCSQPHFCLGYCRKHHYRFKSNGDPTIVQIKPSPARDFLKNKVLNFAGGECLAWPFGRDRTGYGRVHYNGKPYVVSRLVCILVYGEPSDKSLVCAHSCGKGHEGCVNPLHLRWATIAENSADKHIHGTIKRGESASAAKLTREIVVAIRKGADGLSPRDLAARYGIDPSTVSNIRTGKSWAHLPQTDGDVNA